LGNFYVAAIEGVPGGIMYGSHPMRTSFSYLGQPDGIQIGSALAGVDGVGPGGAMKTRSEFCGRCLRKFAMAGFGHTEHVIQWRDGWVSNPVLQRFALVDRQWIAAHGNNELYLTTKQLGADLTDGHSVRMPNR